MKRRITTEQLQELTLEQQQTLKELWKPQELDTVYCFEWKGIFSYNIKNSTICKNCFPLLSIGQMIELLDQYNEINHISLERNEKSVIGGFEWMIRLNNALNMKQINSNLCDALWQAVKQVI